MSVTTQDLYIFDNLDENTMLELIKISSKVEYRAKEIVFYEKDKPKFLHILISGVVRIYKTTQKGQEIVLHDIKAPSLIAELANFDNIPFPATCVTLTECEIVKIDFEKFYTNFISNPAMSLFIIKSLLGKLKMVESFIDKEFTRSAEAKVAILLLENSIFFENSKQVNIAKLLNITPETLSRILARFRNDGLVAIENKKVEILDKITLEKICENEFV